MGICHELRPFLSDRTATDEVSCLDGLSWHLRALHCTVTAFCFPCHPSPSTWKGGSMPGHSPCHCATRPTD